MPDREKVIKTLTDALTAKENYPWARAEMSFEFIEMLLELLEEQEAVVRCMDCKYAAPDMACSHESEWSNEISRNRCNPNWFCADGIAKDTDVPNK